MTRGLEWKKNDVKSQQVLERSRPIAEASSILGDYATGLIRKAIEKGYLPE
ncbi:MAG: hypothetical protein JRJ29_09950 [Deltaproteobacteria bacterium]|nr:hypothetical protein [Deltaproteobacteria bacterium]